MLLPDSSAKITRFFPFQALVSDCPGLLCNGAFLPNGESSKEIVSMKTFLLRKIFWTDILCSKNWAYTNTRNSVPRKIMFHMIFHVTKFSFHTTENDFTVLRKNVYFLFTPEFTRTLLVIQYLVQNWKSQRTILENVCAFHKVHLS